MSLLVHAFVHDENQQMQFVERDHSDELAGFESCRRNLYGSSISKDLGLKFLPMLAESNLFVQTNDLPDLKQEIEIMLDNLELYEKAGFYERDYIEARLKNVLKAIEEAGKINGQIVIW